MGHDLARRVQQSTGGGTVSDPATRSQQPSGPTLDEQIRSMQEQFGLAMPAGTDPAQLVRDALTCLRQTPRLARCAPASVLGGLMTCAQLGLRPGVLGHAWLLPFRDKESGTEQAQLVIGYQGYVDLLFRTGMVTGVDAQTISERDEYRVRHGTDPVLEHIPDLSGKPGAPLAYYAVVHLTNGGHPFLVIPHPTMVEHRDRFALSRNGPWRSDFESMAHKTCLRKLSKWLPKNTTFATALAADETVRTDLSSGGDPAWSSEHVDAEIVTEPAAEAEHAAAETGQA